jgi:hypothetical protein
VSTIIEIALVLALVVLANLVALALLRGGHREFQPPVASSAATSNPSARRRTGMVTR